MFHKQGRKAQQQEPVIIDEEYAAKRKQIPDFQVSPQLLNTPSPEKIHKSLIPLACENWLI